MFYRVSVNLSRIRFFHSLHFLDFFLLFPLLVDVFLHIFPIFPFFLDFSIRTPVAWSLDRNTKSLPPIIVGPYRTFHNQEIRNAKHSSIDVI